MYTYTWYQWLAFLCILLLGWIFESTYVSLKQKRLVNRGFLRLPMLPLYGSGAVMMLWVSLPVRDSLPLVYISGFIAATALEYVTGAVMERLFKVRYWDYSSQPFQLHGYICLSSSIAWGFLTILMTDVIHDPIARTVLAVPPVILLICDFVISVLFTADAYESIKAALALGHTLEAMTKLKADIEELQSKIELLREEAIERGALTREETAEKLAAAQAKPPADLPPSAVTPKNAWQPHAPRLPDSRRRLPLNTKSAWLRPRHSPKNACPMFEKKPPPASKLPKQKTQNASKLPNSASTSALPKSAPKSMPASPSTTASPA